MDSFRLTAASCALPRACHAAQRSASVPIADDAVLATGSGWAATDGDKELIDIRPHAVGFGEGWPERLGLRKASIQVYHFPSGADVRLVLRESRRRDTLRRA